jgi:beta-aspartyl-peptidase (threonine type)
MHLLKTALFILIASTTVMYAQAGGPPITMVVHGGAGTLERSRITPELEKEYRDKLSEALRAGHAILAKGGTSLDAVEAAVRIMEDSPLFNAGKGSVFTREGRNEMDASIMDGRTRKAGAVASVTIIKNPITAARAVMEKGDTVLLSGRGAELFATRQGLETVDPSYFWTQRRWNDLQQFLLKEKQNAAIDKALTMGTVGAVALDRSGNLAAATSTGGRTGKHPGRIGDSPLIGSGNYADDVCAVSGTGTGEIFIRWVAAYDVSALMRYRGLSVSQAADQVVQTLNQAEERSGGLIALDAKGNFAMTFNSAGMYRGYIRADGVPHTAIFKE